MMRTRYLNLLLLAACFPLSARAQGISFPQEGPPAAVALERRAWMGVSVTSPPPSLRHQLKIADGMALLVEFVQPKSPADEAGLKPFDLLLKIDDQWLVNPEQFAVLVRMHHAGDEVKLTVIREGTEQAATVKLVEHEVPRLLDLQGAFPALADPLPGHAGELPPPGPDRRPSDMTEAEKVVTWLDGGKQVSIITSQGHCTLDVKDSETGAVLFAGPIDTEDQRKKLPPEIHRNLDSLSQLRSEFEGRSTGGGRDDEQKPPAPSTQPGDPGSPPSR